MLVIDGSQGEGGGQVLRTSLSLAALTGRAFRLENIRAGRSRPGLRPQHVTAVRAVAALCRADVDGDRPDGRTLFFRPNTPPQPGDYRFDIGTAGATTLILQAVLWPLLFAPEPATVTLTGGTHVPFSPPFHYLAEVARPVFGRFGTDFDLDLLTWGWYPAGQGEVRLRTRPAAGLRAVTLAPEPVTRVDGVATVTNLPSHIPHRMARRAENELREMGLQGTVRPLRERAPSTGAGICLWTGQAGFSALGRKGLPADHVADQALAELRAFLDNQAAVDPHLADQLIIPMALADGTSTFTTALLTQHTQTNIELVRRWTGAEMTVIGRIDHPATVTVHGIGWHP